MGGSKRSGSLTPNQNHHILLSEAQTGINSNIYVGSSIKSSNRVGSNKNMGDESSTKCKTPIIDLKNDGINYANQNNYSKTFSPQDEVEHTN